MTRAWVRVISVIEFVGGVFGVCLILWQLITMPIDLYTIILAPIAAIIYILSLVAGIALWHEHHLGRAASIIIQAIQLPKIISPLLTFTFSFGFDAYIYWVQVEQFSNVRINFKLLAFHQLFINAQDAPIGLGISIPACVFLIKLIKYKHHTSIG